MRHGPGRNGRRGGLLAGLFLTLAIWGCEGNNLFGPGVGMGPQIISMEMDGSVSSGESLQVRTRAVGLVRIDSIVVTVKGGEYSLRQVAMSENNETDFTATSSFEIPAPVTDTLAVVTATAYDAQGNPSLPRVDTVRVFDTTVPTTQTTVSATQVGQGKSTTFQVAATDNIGIARVGYRILNAAGVVVGGDSATVSGKSVERTFTFNVPLEFPLGSYRIEGFAVDLDGNRTVHLADGALEVIFIDEEDPGVTILQPAGNPNVAIGDSLRVVVRVTDNDGIDSVKIRGVAFRGNVDFGTFQEVPRFQEWNISILNPSADTTLTRFLQPTADSTQEAARIIVTAWDRQGNESADTTTVELRADVDPPRVTIFNPTLAQTVVIGDSALVQAIVSDPDGFVRSGVTRLRFEGVAFRGSHALGTFAAVPRFTPKEVQLSPPAVNNQTVSRFLVPTADTTRENVHFIVTAFDGWGNTRADTVVVSMVSDGTAPAVRIIEPSVGSGAPTGDSLFVQARLQSLVGIKSVTYDGVAHRGNRDLGTHVEVTRYSARTVEFNPPVADTILARFLTPTGETASESVWIRAVATDAEGNVQRDSVSITVGGPRVELPDLVSGQPIQGGQQVQIRIVVTDPVGIDQVFLEIQAPAGAAAVGPFGPYSIVPAQSSVEINETWNVPAGATGTYVVRARARNTSGIEGSATPVELIASGGGGADITPPTVRVIPTFLGSTFDPVRMELTDSIRVQVTGQDNPGGAGVIQSGFTLRIVPRSRPTDTLFYQDTRVRGAPASGTLSEFFTFAVDQMVAANPAIIDLLSTPDTLDLDVYGWMRDAAAVPNCGATTSATTGQSLSCGPPFGPGGEVIAAGQTGLRRTIAIVSGRTVRLPNGGSIADAVVDPVLGRGLLFLSNIALSRLEVFNLNTMTFEPSPILIGAQPWGMTFGLLDPNRLFVANSGGTNISVVDVNARAEILADRILTPNTLLFNVKEEIVGGGLTFETTILDFSDRPQFIAQDMNGRFVYSTRPTGAAPDGTIRVADQFGGTTEVYLFTDHAVTSTAENTFALRGVDQVRVLDFSMPPGFGVVTERRGPHSTTTLRSDTIPANALGATATSVSSLRARVRTHLDGINYRGVGSAGYPPAFLPQALAGQWDLASVGLSDTTFVAASGDGSVIAIGEGATATTGRILLWRADASNPGVSAATEVIDLVGNASERVLGVDMNYDGTMGVGRGVFEAYFFDRDLRLQGTAALESGGTGVALHPLHSAGPIGTDINVALAFVPVGLGRIDIYSTINFNRIGRVHIRDNIVGPTRASLPFAADNAAPKVCPTTPIAAAAGQSAVTLFAGASPSPGTDDDCVVVKLSGISADGGVVVVNVTKGDIFRHF